jgi:hypothetical protein
LCNVPQTQAPRPSCHYLYLSTIALFLYSSWLPSSCRYNFKVFAFNLQSLACQSPSFECLPVFQYRLNEPPASLFGTAMRDWHLVKQPFRRFWCHLSLQDGTSPPVPLDFAVSPESLPGSVAVHQRGRLRLLDPPHLLQNIMHAAHHDPHPLHRSFCEYSYLLDAIMGLGPAAASIVTVLVV